MTDNSGMVYENRGGHWVSAGSLYADRAMSAGRNGWDLSRELDQGNAAATAPKWNNLSIGNQTFVVGGH